MKKERYLVLITTAISLYNVGIIWLMQRHIFPGFEFIGKEEWPEYHEHHWQRIRYVVLLPAVLAFGGSALLLKVRPSNIPRWMTRTGFGLQTTAFGLTAVLWGPMLSRFRRGNSTERVQRLVRTHWIRTLLVTAFGILMFWMTAIQAEPEDYREG